MFIIRNETNAFLTNNGKWSYDKTEALIFESVFEAEKLIFDISKLLPAFCDLFPEVISYY